MNATRLNSSAVYHRPSAVYQRDLIVGHSLYNQALAVKRPFLFRFTSIVTNTPWHNFFYLERLMIDGKLMLSTVIDGYYLTEDSRIDVEPLVLNVGSLLVAEFRYSGKCGPGMKQGDSFPLTIWIGDLS